MISFRRNAIIVGILFLAAFGTYGPGNGIIDSMTNTPDYLTNISANTTQALIGMFLMLINSAVVISIGVLLLPILKQHNKTIAFGYLSFRIIEGIILIIGVISLLLLIPLSQEYINAANPFACYFETLGTLAIKGNFFAYQIAMLFLSLGSLPFCYLLYQSNLIPRFLSVWGIVGYAVFMAGCILEIFGFGIGEYLSIPGGLFEIVFAVFLIVKGFNPSAIAFGSVEKS